MNEASNEEVGYNIMEVSNDAIIPISHLPYGDNQKLIIFDDHVCVFMNFHLQEREI